MTLYSFLKLAKSRNVVLYLSTNQKIRFKGREKDIEKLMPFLKEHRLGLIQSLQDEKVILQNLVDIGETDPVIMNEVLEKCRLDIKVKQVFMERTTFDFTLFGCINSTK